MIIRLHFKVDEMNVHFQFHWCLIMSTFYVSTSSKCVFCRFQMQDCQKEVRCLPWQPSITSPFVCFFYLPTTAISSSSVTLHPPKIHKQFYLSLKPWIVLDKFIADRVWRSFEDHHTPACSHNESNSIPSFWRLKLIKTPINLEICFFKFPFSHAWLCVGNKSNQWEFCDFF